MIYQVPLILYLFNPQWYTLLLYGILKCQWYPQLSVHRWDIPSPHIGRNMSLLNPVGDRQKPYHVWSTMAHFVVVLHGTPPITVLPKSHDLLKNGCYRWNPPFLCVPIHWIVLVTFYQSQIRVHSQFHTLQSPFKNSSPLIFHRKIRPFWCLQSAFSRARLSPTRPRRVRRTCPPGTTLRRPGTRSLKP